MQGTKHIVIVGGGVIGLCSAYYAIQRGHRVSLIEAGPPSHDSCSLGNAGLVVPSHVIPLAAPGMVGYGFRMMWKRNSPFSIQPRLSRDLFRWGLQFIRSANQKHVERSAPLLKELNMASRSCFEELAGQSGNAFGLEKKGVLMLCKKEETVREETATAAIAQRLGLEATTLTPEETRRLDPHVDTDIAGAVYYPSDCHLSPNRFIQFLTRFLEKEGVEFYWSTSPKRWIQDSGGIVALQTNDASLEGDEYVVATGSWSSRIARELGFRVPIQAGRGYSLTVESPVQLPSISSLLMEARVAVTPMGSSLRFGGTMEITGLNSPPNPARVSGIVQSVPNYLPRFKNQNFDSVPVWSGLRPCSPDGLPYIGRIEGFSNLSFATGHAMMGLSLGPITGKIMSSLLSDEDPGFDLSLLEPLRFN